MVGLRMFARTRATISLMLLTIVMLGWPAHALAQSTTPTITVIGYGKASATAETALIQLLITQENYGQPRPPAPNATPGAMEMEAVAPVVTGLQDAQVPVEDLQVIVGTTISNFYGPGGRGIARIEINLDAPTQDRINEIIDAAAVGAAQNGLTVGLTGVGFGISDCATLERDARADALEDAWERGELQADLMGFTLTEPISASDILATASDAFYAYLGIFAAPSGCSPTLPVPVNGSPISTAPYDPATPVEVSVYAQVSVVFGATPSDAATPAT